MLWPRILLGIGLVLVVLPFVLIRMVAIFFSFHEQALDSVRVIRFRWAEGKDLVAYEKGPENPSGTLVFIHGTPGSSAAFREQMNGRFPGLLLVAIDRPGFGLSAGDPPDACLDAQTQALEAFLKDRRYPQVILVGHSYGAPIALSVAAIDPGVTGVVLIGGSVDPAYEKPWVLQYVGEWPIYAWSLPSHLRQCNLELLRLKTDLLRLNQQYQKITCPVLMLHGDQDDLVPVGNVEFLTKRFQELGKANLIQKEIFPGWNHFIPWQHPREVNEAIEKFARKVASPYAP